MNDEKKKLSFLQVLGSVMASFIGVQSSEKRERDFTHGRTSHFIGVGILLTLAFILIVFGVVQLVMTLAGPGS
ncbi:MAG: DUF2970 domain-containing protein [Pseudomonadota bacterium]